MQFIIGYYTAMFGGGFPTFIAVNQFLNERCPDVGAAVEEVHIKMFAKISIKEEIKDWEPFIEQAELNYDKLPRYRFEKKKNRYTIKYLTEAVKPERVKDGDSVLHDDRLLADILSDVQQQLLVMATKLEKVPDFDAHGFKEWLKRLPAELETNHPSMDSIHQALSTRNTHASVASPPISVRPKERLSRILVMTPGQDVPAIRLGQAQLRFELKLLADWKYALGDFTAAYVHLSPEHRLAEITVWDPRVEPWQENVYYGLPDCKEDELDDDTVTNIIADSLLFLAAHYQSDPAPIEAVRKELLANGSDTVIWLRRMSKQTKKYLIAPFLKVKGDKPNSVQVCVQLTDRLKERVGTCLICECNDLEATIILGSLVTKDEKLIVSPQKNQWLTALQSLRTVEPIEIPLEEFWKSGSSPSP